jgi:hypothetical protein
MPVILHTCEAEAKPRKKLTRSHFKQYLGRVVCTCYQSNGEKHTIGKSWSRPAWAKSETFSPKTPQKRGWWCSSSVECSLSKHKALSSNPSPRNKQTNDNNKKPSTVFKQEISENERFVNIILEYSRCCNSQIIDSK